MNLIAAFSTPSGASRSAPIAAGHRLEPSAADPRLDALDLASLGLGGDAQPWHVPAFDGRHPQPASAHTTRHWLDTLVSRVAALRAAMPAGELASA